MQWDDIRVFLAVARTGSLTAAGQRLRMDAATVGRRIARLEEDAGATFFVKSPQGYALTEEGQRLTGPAETAEAAMEEAAAGLTSHEGLTGRIRLGAYDGCANYLLPQVTAKIAAENPGLDLQIVALPREADLSRREADIAITVTESKSSRLLVEKLCDYRLSLATSEAWITANGLPRQLSDLTDAAVISYMPDAIFDAELDCLADIGLTRVALASNSVSVQLQWVRRGAGVAMVHDFAMPTAPELGRLFPNQVSLYRTFWMLRPAGSEKDPRLSRIAAVLRDEIRAELNHLETRVRDFH